MNVELMPESDNSVQSIFPPEVVALLKQQLVTEARSELLASLKMDLAPVASAPVEQPAADAPLRMRDRFNFDNQQLAVAALSCSTFTLLGQRVLGEARWEHIISTLWQAAEAFGYSSVPAFVVSIGCAYFAKRKATVPRA